MPEFMKVLQTRRSIRRYKSQAIPLDVTLSLLDLCRYAANAHNSQPFRYIVISNRVVREALIQEMANIYACDLRADGASDSTIKTLTKLSTDRFLNAPVLILACLTMADMDSYSDPKRQEAEYTMAIQSVANSLQNLLLLAHAKGLGANWYCAPLFCPEIVKSILKLPNTFEPQAFITIGVPDETPPPPKRKPLEELIQVID